MEKKTSDVKSNFKANLCRFGDTKLFQVSLKNLIFFQMCFPLFSENSYLTEEEIHKVAYNKGDKQVKDYFSRLFLMRFFLLLLLVLQYEKRFKALLEPFAGFV